MSIKATQPEDSAVKKIEPGSELHFALLGAPMGWNFLTGKDYADMQAFAKAVWNAALATPSPQPATTKEGGEEAATPAYACVRHANGEEKCSRWCGDCLASPALTEARDSIKERYTEQGSNASAGASNPYRAGSKAATYWQSGHAAAASPQPAEAKIAAVDGMTDTARLDFLIEKQMLFAWSTQWTGGNYSNLRAIGTISAKGIESKDVRQVIDAAIATQEGGHD